MSLEEIRRVRLEKLQRLSQAGMPPFPAKEVRSSGIGEAVKAFSKFVGAKKRLTLAGRLYALRGHGGSLFADLKDSSGRVQVYVKKDVVGREAYTLFEHTVDIGDIIETTGTFFLTKKKEKTLEVSSWRMLAKSLRPLPEKWHGLKDAEERFRRRYLDLLMNDEVGERFRLRSAIVGAVRAFFDREGFLEVETPMLQPIAGGALARPFATHHNALDVDLYLRIAPELYLKELLVGGFERVYELGKSFRNEGIDTTHNPEFTTVEWYAAYWDEDDMMACVERCLKYVLSTVRAGPAVFSGKKISWKTPFRRISFSEVLKKYAGIDYHQETRDSLAARARKLGIEIPPREVTGKIVDEIFKKVCRQHINNPTFVIHHPLDISPLAKRREENAEEARRFQVVVGGMEVVNGFAELNDPLDQRVRFEEQARMKQAGHAEAHAWDENFLEALEYGMPPAAGCAISIDRLTMLLCDTKNIREVLLFPVLRPKN